MIYERPQKMKKRRFFLSVTFLFLSTLLTLKTFKKVNVQDININGNELISTEDILKNSSLNVPTPLLFIKTKHVEKELKNNLYLENVSITRQILPFGLKIIIQRRNPIAYGEKISNGKRISGFIDKNGFFIDQEYSDKNNLKNLSIRVFGWKKNFSRTLSKIFNYSINDDNVEFTNVNFSQNGFLTLEEISLKTIILGFNPKIIETQLEIISNLKSLLKEKNILEKIDTIDLTDPNHPKIKVFKP